MFLSPFDRSILGRPVRAERRKEKPSIFGKKNRRLSFYNYRISVVGFTCRRECSARSFNAPIFLLQASNSFSMSPKRSTSNPNRCNQMITFAFINVPPVLRGRRDCLGGKRVRTISITYFLRLSTFPRHLFCEN